MGVDDLVAAAAAANGTRPLSAATSREAVGRAVAALIRDHGWTFTEIVARTAVTRGSAWRWSRPYLTEDQGSSSGRAGSSGRRSAASAAGRQGGVGPAEADVEQRAVDVVDQRG